MAAVSSTMLDLGTPMPAFRLPDIGGAVLSSDQFADAAGVLVTFICPHCPFVKHIRNGLAAFAREYQKRGLAVVAINSNDTSVSAGDNREEMKKEIEEAGYTFPYLTDEAQSVAKAYRAACTPDFFLFDRSRRLVYRGQFDSSRPSNQIPVTGADLRAAADAVLSGKAPSTGQQPSIGCNIKWRPGNAPDYFAG
jgi:peroxiredoxin